VIAPLRRAHGRAAAALALVLPLVIGGAVLGRAPDLGTAGAASAAAPAAEGVSRRVLELAGRHDGPPLGRLAVGRRADGAVAVALVPTDGVELPDVLLYLVERTPTLGGDLPLDALHLGPALLDGRAVEAVLPPEPPWRHVVAFSLAQQRLCSDFALPEPAALSDAR
jgi:hypothetical protein